MAAKDNASLQQFPLAVFSVPSRANAEEHAALAFNVKDGQQSVGQGVEDPYTKAVKYLEKHQIAEVFQNLTARMAYEKPADPLQFMLDEIEKIRRGDKLEGLK